MNPLIHKSLLQSHRQCPRRAWLEFHGTVEPQHSLSSRALLEQGQAVHEAARSLFPGIERVPGSLTLQEAAAKTSRLLKAGASTVAEATFVAGRLGVRVDILERLPDGYGIIEVKSGASLRDEYADDAAIQYAAVTAAGVPIRRVEIMRTETKNVRPVGGTGAEVLVRENVTDLVHWRSMAVSRWVGACEMTILADEPAVAPGEQCATPNPCPFAHYCGKPKANNDPDRVELLPSQAGDALREAVACGHRRISTLPPDAIQHPRNALMYRAVRLGQTVIVREFAEQVARLPYPRHFIDFEAAAFAIPRFENTRAHQSIPFQWSAHRQDAPGAELTHREFIDVTGNDPRRPFAESLIAALGTEGPIFVYSAFERTTLRALAVALPDLSDAIMALVARLVDMLALARRGYYAPMMLGSWSLKRIARTLPATAGVSAYDDLDEIADGLTAQAAYMEQIDPTKVGPQKESRLDKMRAYCENDTRVLAAFVHYVEAAAKSPGRRVAA